eukprot:1568722-Lingulodinium_polyedra.AAC.1
MISCRPGARPVLVPCLRFRAVFFLRITARTRIGFLPVWARGGRRGAPSPLAFAASRRGRWLVAVNQLRMS